MNSYLLSKVGLSLGGLVCIFTLTTTGWGQEPDRKKYDPEQRKQEHERRKQEAEKRAQEAEQRRLELEKQREEERQKREEERKNKPSEEKKKPDPDKNTPPPAAVGASVPEEVRELYEHVYRIFELIDADDDKKISRDEWAEIFPKADKKNENKGAGDFLLFDEVWEKLSNYERKPLVQILDLIDTDDDRKISRTEWSDVFQKSDKGGDNFLGVVEVWNEIFARYRGVQKDHETRGKDKFFQIVHESFKTFDQDKNGEISPEEWKNNKGAQLDFGIADQDENGAVDEDELYVFARAQYLSKHGESGTWESMKKNHRDRQARREQLEKDRKKAEEERKKAGEKEKAAKKAEEQAGQEADEVFDKNDSDEDGKISRDEWKYDESEFDRWDKSGDGYLNRDELIAYFRAQILKKAGTQKE